MAIPITCPTADGNVLSTTGPIKLMGWSLRETGAAASVDIDLRLGGASGQIVAAIHLATSGNDTQWLGDDNGVLVNSGVLYADISGTGVVAGSIWVQ